MFWVKIRKTFPRSYMEVEKFLGIGDQMQREDFIFRVHFRELYDFFDREGLMIVIEKNDRNDAWFFKIQKSPVSWHCSNIPFGTRIEAENAAFMEAFRLLEDKFGDALMG